MINEWSLRQEILETSHRWPLILMYCLVGVLLGLGASLLWPSPHRAASELYVALNIQVWSQDKNAILQTSEIAFNFPDDYKNWQMSNLNAVALSHDLLRETLRRLRQQDPYWNGVTREDLAAMLHVYWRNPGKWRLVAIHSDPQRAIVAVSAWSDLVVKTLAGAVEQSHLALERYTQLQALATTQAQAAARIAQLEEARHTFQGWRDTSSQIPAAQAVGEDARWQLQSAAAQLAVGPAWTALQAELPGSGSAQDVYFAWLDRAFTLIDREIESLQAQVQQLELEKAALAEEREAASHKSLGFSSGMQVEKPSDAPPQVSQVRPTALLALIGGLLGLLAWTLVWLARITGRLRR